MAAEIVRSRSNPLVKRLRALKRRTEGGLLLVEGGKLLEEALAAGVELLEVAAAPRFLEQDQGRRLAAAVERAGAPLRVVAEDVLGSLSELAASPGVLAIARRPAFDEERLYAGRPLVVVGVGLQDPGNVGALLRSAEGAGATGAYLASGTADPLSWRALRGAMGSAFRLPHVCGLEGPEVVRRLRRRGIRLVGAAAEGGRPYQHLDLAGPVALFFGSEGSGLPPELLAALDERASIPLRAPVESLNVAVAAGILLFEAARQRRG